MSKINDVKTEKMPLHYIVYILYIYIVYIVYIIHSIVHIAQRIMYINHTVLCIYVFITHRIVCIQ